MLRSHASTCVSLVVLALYAGPLDNLAAAEDITAIEEEWELIVGTPNVSRSSPQVSCAISPLGHLGSLHAVFDVNQRTVRDSEGGGTQLNVYDGDVLLGSSTGNSTGSLSVSSERVLWTQRMSVSPSGLLTFEILNGSSTTWGKFGGKGELIVSVPTSLANLNAYDANATTSQSGVTFGGGRVRKLTLKKVRIYTGNKKSVEQALERVVHESP